MSLRRRAADAPTAGARELRSAAGRGARAGSSQNADRVCEVYRPETSAKGSKSQNAAHQIGAPWSTRIEPWKIAPPLSIGSVLRADGLRDFPALLTIGIEMLLFDTIPCATWALDCRNPYAARGVGEVESAIT